MRAVLSASTNHEQTDYRHLDKRVARLRLALIVLGKPTGPDQPGETAFHHPPAWLHAEAACAWGALHHLQVPAPLAPVGSLLAALGGSGPTRDKSRHERSASTQQRARANAVVDIRRGHIASDRQSHRSDQQMPLAPLDTLVLTRWGASSPRMPAASSTVVTLWRSRLAARGSG
jgi:hypothetical protein